MNKSLIVVIVVLSLSVSSVLGGGWTSCGGTSFQTKTVELGVYNTKEKCGRHCGNGCTGYCGKNMYSYSCFHHQPEFPNYRCECTLISLCHDI
ncbi:hypothetical protein WIV_gp079 [Wiseana iridescent virus]|uniref:Uncharacterized protein n=1 Tax=Wiseana iridescent virus TaxID=68347 RepID=G0T5A5_IRV9|nr:hypothetical protein WIV_gp079 [Wiseana iridescent virus]ADO00422.1 hypothetical protein [Wiseana iridescent virus]